ncbi:hypothetical protein BC941DRAFT_435090 [Chlamydoabsidia padenii]|nr:hypothetical protein BC941DRAFT_435090 [Chlamydoabsidia padenii]
MTLRTTPPPNIQLKTTAQRRARIKPDMKAKLELEYQKNHKPDKNEKHRMALAFDMTDDNVHFWFQNRRARASRESKSKSMRGAKHQDTLSHQGTSESVTSLVSPTPPQAQSPCLENNAKPLLPHIFTLWDDAPSTDTFDSMYSQSHTSFIPTYFYHSPFGIESSYLKWQSDK